MSSLLLLALAPVLLLLPSAAWAETGKPIVMLGDSLTHQGDWARLLDRRDVDNQGIDGDVSAGVLWRLPGIIAQRPVKIFLMIGINDLRRGKGAEVDERLLANQARIMGMLRAELPQARVYVQSLLPVAKRLFRFAPDNRRIVEVNRSLRELAEAKGCAYLDLHPLFTDEGGALAERLTSDGLHLSAQGYQVWKQAITPHL